RLQGWDTEIRFYDPYIAPGDAPAGATAVSREELLRGSDIVVVLVALTAETRNIIDARTLAWMKPDAYLINVSRGEAIDEVALEQALREGRIAGAALDVSRVEPMPQDHPLLGLDNCFVTPHMIGQTREVFEAIAPVAAENILRLLRGELPLYCKNPGVAERWAARRAALAVAESP
ncbi:MAG: 2-hydroxyacid dehydrogenase, partial [Pigmentiphaga sp.]